MDKLQYKEMLTEEFSNISKLENEINRLQILLGKYMDQQREITKIVYDTPNNFTLGDIIRSMYFEKDKKSDT